MISFEDELEIRINFNKLLQENEENGGSPEETSKLKRRMFETLANFGDEIPYLSYRDEIKEFDWLQETTVEALIKIEKQLYDCGYGAGMRIFKEALQELVQLQKDVLQEMERDLPGLIENFRHQYLLKYAEEILVGIAEVFDDYGIPTTQTPLDTMYGPIYSNKVYKFYSYMYENAPKENKRTIQSAMQKFGITTKDLKKSSRAKPIQFLDIHVK